MKVRKCTSAGMASGVSPAGAGEKKLFTAISERPCSCYVQDTETQEIRLSMRRRRSGDRSSATLKLPRARSIWRQPGTATNRPPAECFP